MITLDDLRPSNTFERRLLEYLVQGAALPVTVTYDGPDLSEVGARVDDLVRQVQELAVRPVSLQPPPAPCRCQPFDPAPLVSEITAVAVQLAELRHAFENHGHAHDQLMEIEPVDG